MKRGKRINSANGYMCQVSIRDTLESEREMSIQIKPLTFRVKGEKPERTGGCSEMFSLLNAEKPEQKL